jgi:hypothetical protein
VTPLKIEKGLRRLSSRLDVATLVTLPCVTLYRGSSLGTTEGYSAPQRQSAGAWGKGTIERDLAGPSGPLVPELNFSCESQKGVSPSKIVPL